MEPVTSSLVSITMITTKRILGRNTDKRNTARCEKYNSGIRGGFFLSSLLKCPHFL